MCATDCSQLGEQAKYSVNNLKTYTSALVMVQGAGVELCFDTAQQLSWDKILCCLLEWHSTSADDGGGISIPCLHCFPYVILMSNAKKTYLQIKWESWIMVQFVPCTPSFVLFSHSTMSAGFRSWEKSCYMYRDLLFLLSRLLLMNDLLLCLNISEYPLLKMHSAQEGSRKQC